MTRQANVRVMLGAVDDHPVVLTGLRAELVDLAPDVELVACAHTVVGLLDVAGELDVVLLDLRLEDGSRPADNVERLLEAGVRVVVYTAGASDGAVQQAVLAGADSVISKSRPVAEVVEAVRSVAAGRGFDSMELAQVLDAAPRLRPLLSVREREVLQLYAAGLPGKSVARQLGIGPATAQEYLKRIRAKYGAVGRPAQTRMELYKRAVEDEVIGPVSASDR